jgi:hypothetical protein
MSAAIMMTSTRDDIVARALILATGADAEAVLGGAYLHHADRQWTATGNAPLFRLTDPAERLTQAWRDFLDSCAATGADPADMLKDAAKRNAMAAPMLPAVLDDLPARVAEHNGRTGR